MLILAVIVFAVIIFALCKSLNAQKSAAGIQGWVVSQDMNGKGKLYKDTKNGIVCKPDIVSTNCLIEEKSSISNGKPREGDKLQVAATLIGIEGATGKKYDNAELRYRDGNYRLTGIDKIKEKAMGIIEAMRFHLLNGIAPQGKPTYNKCKICDFGRECKLSLKRLT